MVSDNEASSGPADTVGERIRARRLELRMSQAAVAEEMCGHGFNWHQNTVHRAENGAGKRVTVDELRALAVVLRAVPGDLLPDWKEVEAA